MKVLKRVDEDLMSLSGKATRRKAELVALEKKVQKQNEKILKLMERIVRATLSLCKFASEAMSTLGCRRLTYPRVSSGLPFLPNKL